MRSCCLPNSLHSYIHCSSTQLLRTLKDPRFNTTLQSIELFCRFKRLTRRSLCCSGDFLRLLSSVLGGVVYSQTLVSRALACSTPFRRNYRGGRTVDKLEQQIIESAQTQCRITCGFLNDSVLHNMPLCSRKANNSSRLQTYARLVGEHLYCLLQVRVFRSFDSISSSSKLPEFCITRS